LISSNKFRYSPVWRMTPSASLLDDRFGIVTLLRRQITKHNDIAFLKS